MGRITRFRNHISQRLLLSAVAFITVASNGCDGFSFGNETALKSLQAQGSVKVLTVEDPLIYQKSPRSPAYGMDYDLLQAFADYAQIKLEIKTYPDQESLMDALSRGEGHLAAARLKSDWAYKGFLQGPVYEETHLSLYCKTRHKAQNIQDLKNVPVSISQRDLAKGFLQKLQMFFPESDIEASPQKPSVLFSKLASSKFGCTIAENLEGERLSRKYLSIEKVTSLTDNYSLSWILAPDKKDLLTSLRAWFQFASRNEDISRIQGRYLSYITRLPTYDVVSFLSRSKVALPEYKTYFQQAAKKQGFNWKLLAAIAYQESHWNPEATSFTGVRGIMQLTKPTADFLGVEDRLDPEQSIQGGAKYLRYLVNRTPKHLNGKERLVLALASYNIGVAHLLDAHELTRKQGKNPYAWKHLKKVLPLLADPEIASKTKYGQARGHETVDFVDRVLAFYRLLEATE